MHKRVISPTCNIPSLEYLRELEATEATPGGEKARKDSSSLKDERSKGAKTRKKKQTKSRYPVSCKISFRSRYIVCLLVGESQDISLEANEPLTLDRDEIQNDSSFVQSPKSPTPVRLCFECITYGM